MCRSPDCMSGARRCIEPVGKRRARQRASYAATKLSRGFTVNPEIGRPRLPDPPDTTAGHAPGSREAVTAAIREAQEALAVTEPTPSDIIPGAYRPGEPMNTEGPDGWTQATPAGVRVDEAMRAAGAAISARADVLAADELAKVGQSERLRAIHPDGFKTRGAYMKYVAARKDELDARGSALVMEAHGALPRDPDESDRSYEQRRAGAIRDCYRDQAEMQMELGRIARADGAWDREEARIYSEARITALKEQRSFGPREDLEMDLSPESDKKARTRLNAAMGYYPTDWTDGEEDYTASWTIYHVGADERDFRQKMPLLVRSSKARAHYAVARRRNTKRYQGLVSELTISDNGGGCLEPGVSTAIHEYGHRMEHMHPQINAIMQTHLAIRTTGDDGNRDPMEPYGSSTRSRKTPPGGDSLESWRRRGGRNRGEWTRPDHFADTYIGKQYDGASSEVLTMGMEGLFAGRFGGLRGVGKWREDKDHQNLVLGVLATVKGKPRE